MSSGNGHGHDNGHGAGHDHADRVARARQNPEWLRHRYGAREGVNNGRETMEVDVLFVGAGPASLAGAIRLHQLIEEHNRGVDEGTRRGPKLEGLNIAVVEKGSEVGRHSLSGSVMNPRAMNELLPGWEEMGAPVEGTCTYDAMVLLGKTSAMKVPITPPPFENHGNKIISLSRFTRWMAGECEKRGINLFCGFPAVDVLWEGDRVVGIRTGDKGIDHHGERKPNFEPGINLSARLTLFGDGVLGNCTRIVTHWLKLDAGRNPPNFETGVKEIIEMPPGSVPGGRVFHCLGFPLDLDTLGGGWVYDMGNNLMSLGLVVSLDYKDPGMDLHYQFQRYKSHPWIARLIEGGKVVGYGAKALTAGGWYARPQSYFNGGMFIGEAAGMLDIQRLKGVHLSMKSGMLAAESALLALLKNDVSADTLSGYEQSLNDSWIRKELWDSSNFHQNFRDGILMGTLRNGLATFFGPGERKESHADWSSMQTLPEYYQGGTELSPRPKLDIPTWNDKLTDIFISGTVHEENQPPHLKVADTTICATICAEEYGNPCTRFCPAGVYEMVEKEGKRALHLNFTNCVHCKTCDIKDPYNIITWVPPEGGGGPGYTVL